MMLEVFVRGTRSVLPVLVAVPLALGGLACGGASSGDVAEARSAEGSTPPAATRSAETGAVLAPSPARGTAWVVFGSGAESDTIFAEVARTADERAQGLMYREELAEDAGMLFVFEDVEERAFWMKDTLIPLDIAYMDPSFRIIDIRPMEPESEELVESSGPAQYALEVNRGWFEAHGVTVGTTPRIFFGM